MMNKDFFFTELKQTRLFFYDKIYNDTNLMNNLIREIETNLNLFSIQVEYNCIKLKIKKTDIRSNGNLSEYYYNIFNRILMNFFNNNYASINQKLINNTYGITGESIRQLISPELIHNFYNIILVSENIVHVQL